MKQLVYLSFVSFLFAACAGADTAPKQVAIVAKGQMPALTKDAANNIHIVYGSHDSIIYFAGFD